MSKVFAFDDRSVFALKRPSLTMLEWINIIKEIDKQKPKMIIFDFLFSILNIPEAEYDATLLALKDLDDVNAELVAGAYSSISKNRIRKEMSLDNPDFNPKSYLKLPSKREQLQLKNYETVSFDKNDKYILGPDPRLIPYLDHIGNIQYDSTGGAVFYPFTKVDNEYVLPHLMMYSSKSLEFYRGNIYANRKLLPVKKDNSAYINYSSPLTYYKKIKPMIRLIDEGTRAKTVSSINKGDIVYFIPEYYTGGTDFKMTPIGLMPGGVVNLAILNSILKNSWIRPAKAPYLYLILGSTLGAVIALNSVPITFFLSLVSTLLTWVGVCLYLFSYQDVVMPLVMPAAAFLLTMVHIFVEKVREADRKSQYIHQALEGSVKPNELKNLALSPEKLKLDARERVVSVMFIDVVGFSLMIERELPRIAFDSLKKVLNDMTDIVHQYDGIVNKNLGDGLLCFFGYSIESDTVSFDHADKAVACALEIQRKNIDHILSAESQNSLSYPLRIGINTSSVFIGNLGSGERLDLNVVGNGVNFAKRLESGVASNLVMIGKTTKELIEPLNLYNDDWVKKYIPIKHHDELAEAWEINPFTNEAEKLRLAEIKQQEIISDIKKVHIWTELETTNILLLSEYGPGDLQSYSMEGLNIILSEEFVKGAKIRIILNSHDGQLSARLEEKGIGSIGLEVIWSYKDGNNYMHGTRFSGIDKEQITAVVNFIKQSDSRTDHTIAS